MAGSKKETGLKKKIKVVAAVIKAEDNSVLITQRGNSMMFPGKWEFPGGKLLDGENPKEGLKREIREELGLEIEPIDSILTWQYSYDFADIDFMAFNAIVNSGKLVLLEHDKALWEDLENLLKYDWLPADLALVDKLLGGDYGKI